MSLINEALKRARVEAARRDAAEKGVPPAALPVYVPPRRQPWMAPIAGFAAGLIVVGLAVGAFWFVRRPATASGVAPVAQTTRVAEVPAAAVAQESSPTSAPVSVSSPAPLPTSRPSTTPERAAASPPPVSTTAGIRSSAPASVPEPAAAPPVVDRSPRPAVTPPEMPPPVTAQPVAVPPAAASPVAAASVAPPVAAVPAPTAPIHTASPSNVGQDRTYMHHATLGSTNVRVDFIVWSESRPFAQINGELLSVGQSIDGFTVLKVERERVELEGRDERFWIRVK